MNSLSTPLPMPPANAFAQPGSPAAGDEDIPLGWECANPALQIERWGLEASAADEPAR